jgi:hypothetical protein
MNAAVEGPGGNMQEAQVGWDPISVNHQLPLEAKLFVLYLVLVIAISFVKSVSLLRQLWPLSMKRQAAGEKTDTKTGQTDLLAGLALANKLPHDHSDSPPIILQEAASKFVYRGELCAAKVSSIQRLVPLTLLVSTLLLVEGSAKILKDITIEKRVWIGLVSGTAAELLVQTTLGLLVCVALYAVSSFYEGVLTRRKAAWGYFAARALNQNNPES